MKTPANYLRLLLVVSLLLCGAAVLRTQSGAPESAAGELEQLARRLRETKADADYARLKDFAARNGSRELGARAALALGVHDYQQKRFAAALAWLEQSESASGGLREYARYWAAMAQRAAGQSDAAMARLQRLRRDFPESVLREDATRSLAEELESRGRASDALGVLGAIPALDTKPDLLLVRARIRERLRQDEPAAADYAVVFYRFPLSDAARVAATRLHVLRAGMGKRFPPVRAELRLARAQALYDARRWRDARDEFAALAGALSGSDRDRAALRRAECRIRLGAPPAVLSSLKLATPELDAERLYRLSQAQRARNQGAAMLATVEQVATRYPASPWTEEALFAAGNYFWSALDRERAAGYYRRILNKFPGGRNVQAAHWRTAWVEYLARHPQAAQLLEEHLRRFPGSPFAANAVYWLGRLAERNGNAPQARSFYLKLLRRFPEDYFGYRAGERLTALGAGPTEPAEILNLIPPPPGSPSLGDALPAAVQDRWNRARALRTIALDTWAERELRAAYASTKLPGLLLEAARSAIDAGRVYAGVGAARQAYPQLEARRVEEGPEEVWRLVYPLIYADQIHQASTQQALDPMLVTGLIRQESVFQPDAVSRVGAVGLMQVMPRTGRQLARQLRVPYTRTRLTNPEYNLRLGTYHFAALLKQFGAIEPTLAAYNAGDDRVAKWQAERSYEEPAEFVESIPFTETREYVQVVLRNADVYRRLYGKHP